MNTLKNVLFTLAVLGIILSTVPVSSSAASLSRPPDKTDLVFQTGAGGLQVMTPQDITSIDVSRFSEIRVVVVNHPSTRGSSADARVQLEIVEGGIVVGNLDSLTVPVDFSTAQENTSVTRTYTVPARDLRIRAEALLNQMGAQGRATIDVLVYGH